MPPDLTGDGPPGAAALRAALESADDGVVVHETDGTVAALNDTAADLLGRPRGALRGAAVGALTAADGPPGEALLEGLHRAADGERTTVEATGVAVESGACEWRVDAADDWVRATVTRTPVEDRTWLVARLSAVDHDPVPGERRDLYRTLVEQSCDGIAVVRDGVFEFANEAMATLTGRSVDELVGSSYRAVVAPEYHDRVADRCERHPGDEDTVRYRVEVVTADGTRRHVDLSVSPIRYRGEPATLARCRDVTEHERRERELERLTTRLELALEGTDTGVWEWNPDTGELFWDEISQRLFGYDPGEFPGTYAAFEERVHAEDLPEVERAVEAALDRGEPYQAEFRVEHPDGETRWLQARGDRADGESVGRDAEADDLWMVGVQTDVTQRKRSERELQAQNERLALLNRVVRHDIRNDMEVIRSSARLVEAHTDEADDEVERSLVRLQQAVDHAVELTTAVRDIMRTADSETTVEPVHLRRVLEDELGTVRSMEAVTVEAPDVPSVRVLADDGLGTVFHNLLTNAVRHNDREHPTVTVSVTEGDERVVVRVADDGPGVPEDRREDVFARGEKGLESPGSGLGLYLVDRLVEEYGGDVWIEDNDPRGAVFAVALRRADAADPGTGVSV